MSLRLDGKNGPGWHRLCPSLTSRVNPIVSFGFPTETRLLFADSGHKRRLPKDGDLDRPLSMS